MIVPSNVTVVADGRVAETVIRGAVATGTGLYGLGPDAIRCVSLYPNAKIKGFTLTGGRTDSNTSVGTEAAKEYPDNIGALVHGIDKSNLTSAKVQVVEDCVLTDGVGRRGGGASYVNLIRCRVTKVRGTDSSGNGSGTVKCYHYGTVVDKVLGAHAVMYPYTFVNSTVRSEYYPGIWNPVALADVRNSVICCSGGVTSGTKQKFVNTYLAEKLANMTDANLDETSKVVGSDALEMDDDGRPVIGRNVAIDKGSAAVYESFRSEIGETDALGTPRVMNGAIDVGALEADWRPRYGKDVGARFAVEAATPGVVESDAGKVVIAAGEALSGTWPVRAGRSVPRLMSFTVAEGGSATVTVDGVSTTYAAGAHEQRFDATAANDVRIACTAGSVTVDRFRNEFGALLFVR